MLRNAPCDIRALEFIIIELIQKYTKDDRAVYVDNLYYWPSNLDVVRFLLETTSATLASILIKVICVISLEIQY